jgi:putative ABC transport system ATP-binding protein
MTIQLATVTAPSARKSAVSSSNLVVSAVDVCRRYGEGDAVVVALKDVTVGFQPATFTAIMGPSGSGKSTLMHILAGLDLPTSGKVFIAGTDITALKDKQLTLLRRTKVGFIFQFFNLLPMLSAEENIVLPLKIAGSAVDTEFLNQLVSSLDLENRRSHRPSALSGGQQQRVAIARALVTRPAVVFADEPTGNLDSKTSQDVLQVMRKAVDDLNQTTIMVTHDARAAAVADRVVYLVDGEVVRDESSGSVDQILDVMKVLR